MQTAIVNMLKAVFSLFKSEKDRPDNYVQLARGNGGEHDQINKRDIVPLMQMESEVLHFGGTMPRSSQIANFMPQFSDQGFFFGVIHRKMQGNKLRCVRRYNTGQQVLPNCLHNRKSTSLIVILCEEHEVYWVDSSEHALFSICNIYSIS